MYLMEVLQLTFNSRNYQIMRYGNEWSNLTLRTILNKRGKTMIFNQTQ